MFYYQVGSLRVKLATPKNYSELFMSTLPLLLRSVHRAFFAVAALLLVAGTVQAQVQLRPQKTEHYRPFAITSSKSKAEKSDAALMKMMCRSTRDNFLELTDLLGDFDLLGSRDLDHSMSFITFRGRQAGKSVEISLAVQKGDQLLMHLVVDGRIAVTCR